MVLEVAASIIGILAAAGKVAETLGPVVSALNNATKNAAAVLSEVNTSRVILAALNRLLDDLGSTPRSRKELIQVNQLRATLTDGILLFSELEALVIQLGNLGSALITRVQWVWNDSEFASFVSRLQNFKNSLNLMLSILRSDSDLQAEQDRQELLSMTSTLLSSNLALSKRLARVENCVGTGNSVYTQRPVSPITTDTLNQEPVHTSFEEANNVLSTAPFGSIQKFLFERDLEASRVYRKAKRYSADFSFHSSTARSHAWTALSDISLSDISAISVIALPVERDDVTNAHHYTFCEVFIEAAELSTSAIPEWPLKNSSRSQTIIPPTTAYYKQPSSLAVIDFQPPSVLHMVVKGAREAEIQDITSQFAYRRSLTPGLDEAHHASENAENLLVHFDNTMVIEGKPVKVHIEVVHDFPLLYENANSLIDDEYIERAQMFMLVFSAKSILSLAHTRKHQAHILTRKGTSRCSTIIVANHCDEIPEPFEQRLLIEGEALANDLGCKLCKVSGNDPAPIVAAFLKLIQARWAFERKKAMSAGNELSQAHPLLQKSSGAFQTEQSLEAIEES